MAVFSYLMNPERRKPQKPYWETPNERNPESLTGKMYVRLSGFMDF